MSEVAELKPCPFCGKSDALEVECMAGTIRHPAYRVRCDWCGAATEYSSSIDPVAAWNTRPAEATLNARADAAEARLAKAVEALRSAQTWHEENDKALSKQPPSHGPNGTQWARLQHQEQMNGIRAALSELEG